MRTVELNDWENLMVWRGLEASIKDTREELGRAKDWLFQAKQRRMRASDACAAYQHVRMCEGAIANLTALMAKFKPE